MRKQKIYLDTSVISHLDAPDALEKQQDTRRLWEEIHAGKKREGSPAHRLRLRL